MMEETVNKDAGSRFLLELVSELLHYSSHTPQLTSSSHIHNTLVQDIHLADKGSGLEVGYSL